MAVESMRGNLSTNGRLRANLAVGGGTDVTITPTYNSGIKIADFTLNNTQGALYIPNYPIVDDLSEMTWTLITSTTTTSDYYDIGSNWKYIVLMGSISNTQRMYVSADKLSDLFKALEVSGASSIVTGHEWYDFAANHTYCIAELDDTRIRIKSGYSTVTCYLYALS